MKTRSNLWGHGISHHINTSYWTSCITFSCTNNILAIKLIDSNAVHRRLYGCSSWQKFVDSVVKYAAPDVVIDHWSTEQCCTCRNLPVPWFSRLHMLLVLKLIFSICRQYLEFLHRHEDWIQRLLSMDLSPPVGSHLSMFQNPNDLFCD